MDIGLNKNKTLGRLGAIFSSIYLIPFVFGFAFICNLLDLQYFSVITLAVVVVCIVLFCKDVKNIFGVALYACFYIGDIAENPNWLFYSIAIGIAVVSFIGFVIYKLITDKKCRTIKNGKFYPALFISSVAFLLGGIIGNFKFLPFLATFGFCVVSLIFYWMAINFTKDLSDYLFKLFIIGAFLICLTIFAKNVELYMLGHVDFVIWGDIFTKAYIWPCAQNINVCTLFILMGVVSCFFVKINEKHEFLMLILACILLYFIIISTCRVTTTIGLIVFVFLTIRMFARSKNRKKLFIAGAILLAVATAFIVINIRAVWYIIYGFILKTFGAGDFNTSGRIDIWSWCLEKFLEFPIFGIGFITDGSLPGVRENFNNFVLAHNTVIQWICSLGLIGVILMTIYYIRKYKIIAKGLKIVLGIALIVILIEVIGMFDQAPSMDIFVHLIIILCIGSIERKDIEKKKKEKLKKIKTEKIN